MCSSDLHMLRLDDLASTHCGYATNTARLQGMLEDARHEEDQAAARLRDARAAAEAEMDAARLERARKAVPAHQKAVCEIAVLLDKLGVALESEARIRRESGDLWGQVLPDLSVRQLGRPSDPNSGLSAWFRRARQHGLLAKLERAA